MHKKQIKKPHQNRTKNLSTHKKPLRNKIVLLIGNDAALLQALTLQLAQKGADIALICQHLPAERVRHLKDRIESLGQRFLLILQKGLMHNSDRQLLADRLNQTIVNGLGHLDIFIDLTAGEGGWSLTKNQTETNQTESGWQVRMTILQQLIHSSGD